MDSLKTAWQPNWIYKVAASEGWINYRTKVPDFDPQRMSVLNPSSQLQAGVRYRFGGSEDVSGRAIVLTSMDAPRAFQQQMAEDDISILRVELHGQNQQVIRSATVILFASDLQSGADLASALKAWTPEIKVDANQQRLAAANFGAADAWIVRILQGLSLPKAYRSASERYLKYRDADGEMTAVRCDRGAARIRIQHPEEGSCWQQCNVFYCDALAFGVARWTVILTSEETGKVIREETWTCRELP